MESDSGHGHISRDPMEHEGHQDGNMTRGRMGHGAGDEGMTHDSMRQHGRHEGMNHGQMEHGSAASDQAAGGEHDARTGHDQGHGAHVSHAGHERMFRTRFWICLALTVPVLVFSPGVQDLLGYRIPAFPGGDWISPLFAVVIFLYGGIPFLRMAVPEIQSRKPGMMTLISLAISVALIYSLAALFLPKGDTFFWELATLIDIMLLGHWLEIRSVRQASGALNELAKLLPDTAERMRADGTLETVPAGALRTGDRVLVRPGAAVPADGQVIEGESEADESMITGESRPVAKAFGSKVIAGTINGSGSLRLSVTATGDQTALAGIMRLVRDAQESKSAAQLLADRAAGWLFYIALAVAALTAAAWTLATGFNSEVIARVATVLVIACPHALGLAVPLVVAITTSLGARNGILVRDRLALELARDLRVVIFDKTGTLTRGAFGVAAIRTMEGWKEEDALAAAAAVESDSEHPIARAIRNAARDRGLTLRLAEEFEAIKGRGVRARVGGETIHVGGPPLLAMMGIEPPPELARFTEEAGAKGQTAVYLVRQNQAGAALAVADVVRPESAEAVKQLHAMGVEVDLLTGDAEPIARAVAAELGIDQYFAGVLPENKEQKVAEVKRGGRKVAMVGDGVNDAPALARADVGIAIGSGTDVAIESAGIILVKSDPRDVARVIRLSRASYRKMIQNLIWAAGYNVVALPLAAGVLAPWGIVLSPAVGAALMSLSTIIVALNAQLLRGTRLDS